MKKYMRSIRCYGMDYLSKYICWREGSICIFVFVYVVLSYILVQHRGKFVIGYPAVFHLCCIVGFLPCTCLLKNTQRMYHNCFCFVHSVTNYIEVHFHRCLCDSVHHFCLPLKIWECGLVTSFTKQAKYDSTAMQQ